MPYLDVPIVGLPYKPGQSAGPFTDIGNGLKYAAEQCTAFVADTLGWVPAGWGPASNWLDAARKAGYKTGSTPAVGDVIVWGASAGGGSISGAKGHVAVVEAINPSTGLPTVAEANYRYATSAAGVGRMDERSLSPAEASAALGYIKAPSNWAGSTAPAATQASNPLDVLGGLAGGIVGALGSAIGAALTTIGAAIATTLGVAFTDLSAVIQNHLVPVAVAAVVTAALFA